ncbi:exosortase-associated EpsI family protein [Humisphaera borealis]|uniref:Exosortase-associated EpsI family protein n=1 Tax=Humisphaera borealis TaxID=2807512 RepID=A0A7M2X0E7_9BACT|nr:exosortase-associated EpsI family protein [Humisphaera borealis]QOV91165.1 exosortase-associated EpsI family protein [Humisphaera borealis]
MRSFLSIIAGPGLCLGILSGIVWENGRHTKPADAEPFHAAARSAVDAWPRTVGDWTGRDVELPRAAIQLLKPNAHFCRTFYNTRERNRPPVSLLVVQCRDPIDMSGHYPPNCYPNNGKPQVWEAERKWTIPGEDKPIRGMEYHFESGSMLHPQRTVVYNFFVLPGKGVVADMQQVRDASGDFQRRHFGAAQVQVVFEQGDVLEQSRRDEIFTTLIGANPGVLSALSSVTK